MNDTKTIIIPNHKLLSKSALSTTTTINNNEQPNFRDHFSIKEVDMKKFIENNKVPAKEEKVAHMLSSSCLFYSF